MEKEILEKYVKAGEIAKECKKTARKMLKDGIKIIDIAEKVESLIRKMGATPAFPVNISVNEVAAHYTPDINDPYILRNGDLDKVDIVVMIDGYIADTAFSVMIGEKSNPLIDAAEKTLERFFKKVRPGKTVAELSELVENSIKEFGFNPVRNLAGHGLERYVQHAEPSIPNGKVNIQTELKEGQVIAMEVFVTNGVGWVKESYPILIYRYLQDKAVRMRESRIILEMSKNEFKGMPFAKRWIKNISPTRLTLALNELVSKNAIIEYPILKEKSNGIVAQAEETVVLMKKPIITTKI